MAKKISGAQFKAFYKDDSFWPKGAWFDGDCFVVDGREVDNMEPDDLSDDAQVQILGGVVLTEEGEEICSLSAFYSRWAKAQTHERVVIEVPRDKLADLDAALKALSGRLA